MSAPPSPPFSGLTESEGMIKYETTITWVGEMVSDFAREGVLIFFGEEAPEELHDFSVLTNVSELVAPVTVGDTLEVDEAAFRVTAVGEVANQNIGALGHLVVKLNGLDTPELPGDVSVVAGDIPELAVGTRIRISSQED